VPDNIFLCARSFAIDGKRLDCDSNVRRDGEKLRPLFEPVPEAISALNLYQHNRRNLKTAAYVGTAGIVIGAWVWLAARMFFTRPGTSEATDTGILFRNLAGVSGLSISAGAVVYGLTLTRTNERNLGRAVDATMPRGRTHRSNCSSPRGWPSNASSHRHPPNPPDRQRTHRDRPSLASSTIRARRP